MGSQQTREQAFLKQIQSNYTLNKSISHQNNYLGHLDIYRHNTQHKYIAHKLISITQSYHNPKQLLARSYIQHTNLVTVQAIQNKPSQCCSQTKTISYYFQFYPHNLQKQIHQRSLKNDSFKDSQIKTVLLQTAKGIKQFHKARKAHSDIRPQNILLTMQGFIKVFDNVTITQRSAYQEFRRCNAKGYLSPSEILALNSNCQIPIVDKQKSDIYALGMVGLQLGTLESMNKLYIRSKNMWKLQGLDSKLNQIRGKLCQELCECIQRLLQVKQQNRPDIEEAIMMMQKIQVNKQRTKHRVTFQRQNDSRVKSPIKQLKTHPIITPPLPTIKQQRSTMEVQQPQNTKSQNLVFYKKSNPSHTTITPETRYPLPRYTPILTQSYIPHSPDQPKTIPNYIKQRPCLQPLLVNPQPTIPLLQPRSQLKVFTQIKKPIPQHLQSNFNNFHNINQVIPKTHYIDGIHNEHNIQNRVVQENPKNVYHKSNSYNESYIQNAPNIIHKQAFPNNINNPSTQSTPKNIQQRQAKNEQRMFYKGPGSYVKEEQIRQIYNEGQFQDKSNKKIAYNLQCQTFSQTLSQKRGQPFTKKQSKMEQSEQMIISEGKWEVVNNTDQDNYKGQIMRQKLFNIQQNNLTHQINEQNEFKQNYKRLIQSNNQFSHIKEVMDKSKYKYPQRKSFYHNQGKENDSRIYQNLEDQKEKRMRKQQYLGGQQRSKADQKGLIANEVVEIKNKRVYPSRGIYQKQ